MCCVDQSNHDHARKKRLVQHECLQLQKSPGVQNCSLFAPNRDPFANTGEIFQFHSASGAFGAGNNLLRDAVIRVVCKAGLPARKLFQATIRRCGSKLLKLTAQVALSMAYTLNLAPAVQIPVRVGGDVVHSKVNPEKRIDIGRVRFLDITCRRDVELTAMVKQVGFTLPVCEQRGLTRAALEHHAASPAQCPDRNGFGVQIPRQDSVVVGKCSMLTENSLLIFVELVGVNHFGDAAYDNLSGQSEAFTNGVVDDLVQRRLPKFFRGPCSLADPIAGAVSRFQRLAERPWVIWEYLDFGYELQYTSIMERGLTQVKQISDTRKMEK